MAIHQYQENKQHYRFSSPDILDTNSLQSILCTVRQDGRRSRMEARSKLIT